MEYAMEDYVGLLIFFVIILVNFLVSLSQKAKAQQKRDRRIAKTPPKTPEAPTGKPVLETAKPKPTIRPKRPVQPRWMEASRPISDETAQPAEESTRRTKDIIREWSKRLEEAFDLETMETPWEEMAPESPATPKFASAEKQPAEIPKTPQATPQKPSHPPAVSVTSPQYAVTVRKSSVEFLGKIHPNPIVNGIILCEILSKPVWMREEKPLYVP